MTVYKKRTGRAKKTDTKDAKLRSILDDVKKDIRPDSAVIKDADDIVLKINNILKSKKIDAVCVKGGSLAKETFLKDDYDIDLFIRFNQAYRDLSISDISQDVISILCKDLKAGFERIHGSRDYFQFKLTRNKKILDFEIIPVMLVHSQNYMDAQNITDLSPEHVFWVKSYTQKNPELCDEIRLAKQFCKANKVYGAESYINGFSGHILDILVIHYGSFLELIKAFSKFDEKAVDKHIIIDTEKNLSDPLKQLNQSKITPLILVDPIQKDRNSAAALGKEKLMMFIHAAKAFLNDPSKKFFEIRPFDLQEEIKAALRSLHVKKQDIKILRIKMETDDSSKDIAGTKALKAHESIVEQLKLEGFNVLNWGWHYFGKERLAESYILIDAKISKEVILSGPPINAKDDYRRFLEKHEKLKHKIKKKNDRIYAIAPRKFMEPLEFARELAKKDFISKRVKKIILE